MGRIEGKIQGAADAPRGGPRDRLVEVAARHFAESGFEGASQRAIQREVGVNPATAHYYFGSKEALYQAVIERYLGQIQSERMAALPAAEATPGAEARFRALLVAYLSPHIRTAASEEGYNYARILAAIQFTTTGLAHEIIIEAVAPVRDRYRAALHVLFPAVPVELIRTGLHMTVMLMAMAPIHARAALKNPRQCDKLIADVVNFSAAGFRALCGPPTV